MTMPADSPIIGKRFLEAPMSISQRIRELRAKSKLSQDEFAKKLGVSRAAVAQWETGKTRPSFDSIRRISEEFQIHSSAILEDSESEFLAFASASAAQISRENAAKTGTELGQPLPAVLIKADFLREVENGIEEVIKETGFEKPENFFAVTLTICYDAHTAGEDDAQRKAALRAILSMLRRDPSRMNTIDVAEVSMTIGGSGMAVSITEKPRAAKAAVISANNSA